MDLVPIVKRSSETAPSSNVPEHAAVMIPGELQQRIGVRTGRVEKGPLDMSVEADGDRSAGPDSNCTGQHQDRRLGR